MSWLRTDSGGNIDLGHLLNPEATNCRPSRPPPQNSIGSPSAQPAEPKPTTNWPVIVATGQILSSNLLDANNKWRRNKMLIEHNQTFHWKVCGENVPLGFAEISATVRNPQGHIVQELDTTCFVIDDYDKGVFSLISDKLSPEAASIQIYGQLPNINRVIITKGDLSPAVAD